MSAEAQAQAATPKVQPPRTLIGAPDEAWNPTVTVMLGVLLTMALLIGGLATGRVSPWWASPMLGVAYYAIFTVLHESMHGLAHRNRAVNRALGRVAGFALMLPLPMFRAAHLAHHSHTNDPAQDPDLMVMRRPAWFRPVWFLVTPFHYRRMVYSGGLLRGKEDRIEAIATEAAIVASIAVGIATGNGILLLLAWVLPAMLAILFLALAFDLLPHYPHTSQERYYDTRAYPGPVLNVLLLGQNYHLIHHLWTTIPWYRYQPAFHEVKDELVARGAPIGWHSRAETPPDLASRRAHA